MFSTDNNQVTAERIQEFLDEALIMAGFSHDHVLTLHGVVIRGLKPHVVLEYMDKGDLRSYVANLERVGIHCSQLYNYTYIRLYYYLCV